MFRSRKGSESKIKKKNGKNQESWMDDDEMNGG